MASTWGTIQSTDANFLTTLAGASLTQHNFIKAGHEFNTGTGKYEANLAFYTFDTSDLIDTPDALYWPAGMTNDSSPDPFTIYVAEYNFGTLTTADWVNPAGLAALTPIGSASFTGWNGQQMIQIPIDPSGLTFGGDLQFIIWTNYLEEEIDDALVNIVYETSQGRLTARFDYVDPGAVGSWTTEVAADTPELWWEFNETSGIVAADSSGNGHTGTYVNTIQFEEPSLITGSPSSAIYMSTATNGYIQSDDNFADTDYTTDGMTLEVVFASPNVSGNEYSQFIGWDNDDYTGIETWGHDPVTDQSVLGPYLNSASSVYDPVYGFFESYTKNHVVLTYPPDGNPNNVLLYVNGDIYQSAFRNTSLDVPQDSLPLVLTSGDVPFYVNGDGWEPGGNGPPYPPGWTDNLCGRFDEGLLYASELSPTRVRTHFKASGAGGSVTLPSFPDQVTLDNPVVWLRLDETSGTDALDSSGNGNDWTRSDDAADTNGLPIMNGSNNRSTFIHPANNRVVTSPVTPAYLPAGGLPEYTMELVLGSSGSYPPSGFDHLYGSNPSYPFFEQHDTGFVRFRSEANQSVTLIGPELTPNHTWHLCATYDGSVVRLYVNGVLEDFAVQTGNDGVDAGQFFEIGIDGGGNYAFDADEALFYDYALSAERVEAHALAVFSGSSVAVPPSPLNITDIDPDIVDVDGGEVIAIIGTTFDNVISVTIDGDSVPFFISGPTLIYVTAPAHAAGTVVVEVASAIESDTFEITYTDLSTAAVAISDPSMKVHHLGLVSSGSGTNATTVRTFISRSIRT